MSLESKECVRLSSESPFIPLLINLRARVLIGQEGPVVLGNFNPRLKRAFYSQLDIAIFN
jgi:hypothetical protein